MNINLSERPKQSFSLNKRCFRSVGVLVMRDRTSQSTLTTAFPDNLLSPGPSCVRHARHPAPRTAPSNDWTTADSSYCTDLWRLRTSRVYFTPYLPRRF